MVPVDGLCRIIHTGFIIKVFWVIKRDRTERNWTMKKIISITMVAMMLTGVFGCGSKETVINQEGSQKQEEVQQSVEQIEESVTGKEETQKESTGSGVLAGVYSKGDELIEIPMGTYFEGEQKVFCKVKISANSLFAAHYTPDGEKKERVGEANGGNSLAFCIERGLLEEENAICWALAGLNETLNFEIVPTEQGTIEDVKAMYPNAVEMDTQEYSAVYYVDSNEYALSDIVVYISLNEKAGLFIGYKGPLTEEISTEQLTQNLYDLVTVVE